MAKLLFGVIKEDEAITHRECFIAPSIHQLEYRIGNIGHIFANVILTPIAANKTRITLAYAARLKLPKKLISPLVRQLFSIVIQQDCRILNLQAQNRQYFRDAKESSTPLDVFGLEVRSYIERLCRGESSTSFNPIQRTIKLSSS